MDAINLTSLNPNSKLQTFNPSRSQFNPPLTYSPPLHRALKVMATSALQRSEHDVVVIGAGIIGLSIARQLLLHSNLSVAVVDAAVPCSGATGAGQGYIWMAHKNPGSETWELAMRSKKLWHDLARSIDDQGMNPADVLGWKETGSLLIGRNCEELNKLEERVKLLNEVGVKAEYLSTSLLQSKEPALEIGKSSGAAFLPEDCQLDAFKTVDFIEKGNKYFSSGGRYTEFYHDPAVCLVRSGKAKTVEAVQTSKRILYAKTAVVIASGAWTSPLMQSLILEPNILPEIPIKPRKGYLLVLENFDKIQLNHALMEAGYIYHQASVSSNASLASKVDEDGQNTLSVSMTATIDVKGNFVLGSSREFNGFDKNIDESIIRRIWTRAAEFFPALRDVSLDNHRDKKIKIGHRPYMPDGKPVIGPIPNLPNCFLAAGHEGSGLCLALGTAEIIADMILGNSGKVDYTPYKVEGRFC